MSKDKLQPLTHSYFVDRITNSPFINLREGVFMIHGLIPCVGYNFVAEDVEYGSGLSFFEAYEICMMAIRNKEIELMNGDTGARAAGDFYQNFNPVHLFIWAKQIGWSLPECCEEFIAKVITYRERTSKIEAENISEPQISSEEVKNQSLSVESDEIKSMRLDSLSKKILEMIAIYVARKHDKYNQNQVADEIFKNKVCHILGLDKRDSLLRHTRTAFTILDKLAKPISF